MVVKDLLTIRRLRELTGKPAHVINHALDRYGPEPSGKIGITRVWPAEALPEIQKALELSHRRGKEASP